MERLLDEIGGNVAQHELPRQTTGEGVEREFRHDKDRYLKAGQTEPSHDPNLPDRAAPAMPSSLRFSRAEETLVQLMSGAVAERLLLATFPAISGRFRLAGPDTRICRWRTMHGANHALCLVKGMQQLAPAGIG